MVSILSLPRSSSTSNSTRVNVLIQFIAGYSAFIHGFTLSTFMTSYIGIAVYLVNIVGWRLLRRTQRVSPKAVDFAYTSSHVDA